MARNLTVKIIFLFFLCLLHLNLSNAQDGFKFGVKAGSNFSGYHSGQSVFTDDFGYRLGGIAQYNINDTFTLQGELLYNKKGGRFNVYNSQNIFEFTIESDLDYIDIPIILKIYVVKKLAFEIGPQIGLLINSKGNVAGESETLEFENINTIDFSLNGGLSYDIGDNFLIQARYGYGLSEIFENESSKNSVISLSIGYFFK
jgi:opacity protein-like surface antigen